MHSLPRTLLRQRIAAETVGVVFLRAPGGAGKTTLLAMLAENFGMSVCTTLQPRMDDIRNGRLLWDLPVSARSAKLSAHLLEAVETVFIACRPDQRVNGLARHIVHKGSTIYDADSLTLTERDLHALPPAQARRLLDGFAGWPAFLPLAASPDERTCIDYLRETFLDYLRPAEIIGLSIWLDAPSSAPVRKWNAQLPPFLTRPSGRHGDMPRLLKIAIAERLATFEAEEEIYEIAAALEQAGRPLAAMGLLLNRGHEHQAAQILERANGRELLYHSSLKVFQYTIVRFSPQMLSTNETVLFAVARTLLKQGELQRVRHLLARHLGSDYLDPLKVLIQKSRFSFAARTFRLNLMISEDLTPNDSMIARLGEFMADYPIDDHGKWAGYYNSILEFEIRRRNFREAEAAAARALIYLKHLGGQPLLEFFIHIHQTVLRLVNGDALLARRAAIDARSRLEQVPHEAEQEFRILRLVEACLAYEAGGPRPLLDFVNTEFDRFATAEIWPSLMQFALHYASQVLADHFPMGIRPGFLDGLWIHLSEGLQFHAMMEIRTAIAYQNTNRWEDATVILSAVSMPMGRNGVESAIEELTRLARRDEIAYAMAWLREAVHQWTPRSYLSRQIDALIANPKVTHRERIALQLWQSYAAFQRGDIGTVRARLLSTLEAAMRLGCKGVLSEERVFLFPLLSNKRIRGFVEISHEARTALSILATSIKPPHTRALQGGLSRREAQMLQLLEVGMSNKRIARTLNISEVTVKFHLGNLFKKLDCRRRAEAVRAAKSLGWL